MCPQTHDKRLMTDYLIKVSSKGPRDKGVYLWWVSAHLNSNVKAFDMGYNNFSLVSHGMGYIHTGSS